MTVADIDLPDEAAEPLLPLAPVSLCTGDRSSRRTCPPNTRRPHHREPACTTPIATVSVTASAPELHKLGDPGRDTWLSPREPPPLRPGLPAAGPLRCDLYPPTNDSRQWTSIFLVVQGELSARG